MGSYSFLDQRFAQSFTLSVLVAQRWNTLRYQCKGEAYICLVYFWHMLPSFPLPVILNEGKQAPGKVNPNQSM